MSYFEQNLLRKKEIEDILMSLMREIPYEQIAVKNLTEQLQLARKTFYHYFPSKHACLESLADRIIQECALVTVTLPEHTDAETVCRERLRFWMRNRDFLDIVIRNGLAELLVERTVAYILQEDNLIRIQLSTRELPCDEEILYFYISGQIRLLLKWCREDFSCPLEEMVRKQMRLFYEPLLTREV